MNEDRILSMFFEKARWQYAIEKGLFKDMNKAVMYQLTEPKARLAMYQRIKSGNYKIMPPHTAKIPKDNGDFRTVYVNEAVDRILLSIANDFIYKEVIKTRAINSAIYHEDPERYFKEIDNYLNYRYSRAFRFHIGGDIQNKLYLDKMCEIARKHKDTKFLAFTKMFDVCNEYLDEGNVIPENMHILFSGWLGLKMDNRHGFPEAHPIFESGTSAPQGTLLCTGNCTECLKEDRLCWSIGKGEAVGFLAH